MACPVSRIQNPTVYIALPRVPISDFWGFFTLLISALCLCLLWAMNESEKTREWDWVRTQKRKRCTLSTLVLWCYGLFGGAKCGLGLFFFVHRITENPLAFFLIPQNWKSSTIVKLSWISEPSSYTLLKKASISLI